MSVSLVQLHTRDGLELPGLLYEPARRTRTALIFLHGNGDSSVFYPVARTNAAGELLGRAGIAYFAFNNRGAHYVKRIRVRRGNKVRRVQYGTAYERIRECVHDIDAAIAFLRRRGYRKFILAGESTGANKICVYNWYRPRNPITQYLLLAPGDDVGIYYKALGRLTFLKLFKEASSKAKKAATRRKFVPHKLLGYPMSWQSLHDTMNPDGDYNAFPFLELLGKARLSRKKLFRYLRAIRKPTSIILGECDEYCYGKAPEIVSHLRTLCKENPQITIALMRSANHGFYGKERALYRMVAKMIEQMRGKNMITDDSGSLRHLVSP